MPPNPQVDAMVTAITEALTTTERSSTDVRNISRLLEATRALIVGDGSSLDVKIAAIALAEMTRAFDMFAPYRHVRKVTIFGSARTTADNPIYGATAAAARALADSGYMVVTGAGPGIMEAGMIGAGREKSIGVSIRLPFETGANSVIAGDDKYVSMRYFFTRKLMLVKESHGFLCLPGGFGTLDETFELLTLAQTAKSVPVPIVFLEVPGDPFWSPLMEAMEPLLLRHGLISPSDTSLYLITDDVNRAVDEITGFYRNYHSIRFVGDLMYIRMQRPLPAEVLAGLAAEFGHLSRDGIIAAAETSEAELRDDDNVRLARIALAYSAKGFADLRPLIDLINRH